MNLSQRVVYILLVFVSVAAYAEDRSFQSSYDSGKELAKNKHGSVLSSLQNFKPEAVFNGFTSQPNEAKHYGGVQQSVDTLKSPVVVSEETANPVAKTLRDNFGSRPQYKVDASADSIKNSQWMIDHANEVTRGKSCKKIPACETTYESKTCQEEASLRWYYCQKTLNVKVNNQVHESHYPITVHLDSDRYYIGATIDVFSGRIIDHGPHDSKIWIDGRLPANIDCHTLSSTITSSTINRKYIDGIHYPACGDLSLTIHVTLPKNSKVSGKVGIDIVSRRVDTTIDETWEDGCTKYANDSQCKLELDQCTQGKETRVIGGEQITRDCWAKNLRYACQAHVNIPNTCEPLRQTGCEQTGSVCHTQLDDKCVLYDQTFRCPLNSCSSQEQTICTEEPACINGDCSSHEKTPDPDFNQAVGSFGAMVDAAQQMDKNNHLIFKGDSASCSKAPIGFLNCCTDSGWGQELFEKCSDEEKKLMKDKENHITVEIPGDYCAHEVGGVCTSFRKRYCVFTTKLARLIQEKGRRDQLHIGFGTPKDPQCTGISPEDLQNIDFSRIDFTEIAEDMMKTMPTRDQEALAERIRQRVKEMGQSHD